MLNHMADFPVSLEDEVLLRWFMQYGRGPIPSAVLRAAYDDDDDSVFQMWLESDMFGSVINSESGFYITRKGMERLKQLGE